MACFCRFVLLVLLCSARPVLGAAPANDNFLNATPISGPNATIVATNVEATKEIGEPDHAANPGGRSVWWKWTAPAIGAAFIQTTNASFDTLLAVYTANSIMQLSDSVVASNDDDGAANTSRVAFNVKPGATYHIAVDGFDGSSGSFTLLFSYRPTVLPNPPPNDNFTNRIQLQGTHATVTADSYFATKQSNEPSHANELGGASLWWTWTAPTSGQVTVDTSGSDFDTLLAVYRGNVLTNLELVASNDDAATNQSTSLVTFPAIAGTTYQIAVDGFHGAAGDVQLNLAMPDVVLLAIAEGPVPAAVQLEITAAIGHSVTLETSTDLVKWQPLTTLPNPSGTVAFTDTGGGLRRYYRAKQEP